MVEAIIYAFVRMLHRARPGRFEEILQRVAAVKSSLARNERNPGRGA
jgi:hypothetical protein